MSDCHPETELSFDDTYKDTKDMFGKPCKELQDYFTNRTSKGAVLDLGCGQGRDALFLALVGYNVTAVDSSKVGVAQMLDKANEQNLKIHGLVGDILDIHIEEKFDVILFDMVLHAFETPKQTELLQKYSNNASKDGFMCIVFPDDMATGDFMEILDTLPRRWVLRDEIVIRDIPKLNDEEIDFTFMMMCAQ